MTLKEIAKQANVSISTVSRVLNGKQPSAASPEVQERILSIARNAGYSPNTVAQNLKSGNFVSEPDSRNTKSIAVLFARTPFALTDPYFSQLIKSIEEATTGTGYSIKYMYSASDFEDPAVLHDFTEDKFKGIIILGRCSQRITDYLKRTNISLAYVGLNEFDAGYDQILCEGFLAAFEAVSYLIRQGHTSIAYVGESENEIRYKGYCAALEANGIAFKQEHFTEATLSFEGGYAGAKNLVSQSNDITAIFCANDITAIGAVRALREESYRIPDDISIIGIDDIPAAQYMSPALTTVHIPIDEMGSMTLKMLIDRIEGGHRLPVKILLPFHIVERETCARPV